MNETDATIYDFPAPTGADLEPYEPAPLPVTVDNDGTLVTTSILDVPLVPDRGAIMEWLDECYWGIRLRVRKAWIHFTRSPLYAARASRHSGRGLVMVTWYWWAWVRDWEILAGIGDIRRDGSVDAKTTEKTAAELRAERTIRVRKRWAATIAGLIAAPLLYRYAWNHHLWAALLIGLAIVVGLGLIGAQRGDVVQYVDEPTEMILTVDAVINAFYKSKIAPKPEEPVRVLGVPHQVGLGMVVKVELPSGGAFAEVLSKRENLASGLNCPSECLELDRLPGSSERVLELFIADQPPEKMKVPAWPLMTAERFDIFQGVPVGWTPRGELVHLSLLWVHTLIGAAPRRGKTSILRLLALATLMDPRAQLIVVDFGGGPDYKPLRPHCLKFIHGPADAQVEEFLELLGWLNAEYQRRQAALDALPIEMCPEARLTPALAERPEFAPIVIVVDEFQVATLAKKIGEETKMGELIVETWAALEKVFPKVGGTFIKATQSADDSVPTELRNISLQRVALSMASHHASMAVLGNTAQRLGYDASTLGGLPGLAFSWGTDSDTVDGYRGKLRFANVTPADAAGLLERVASIRRPRAVETGPTVDMIKQPTKPEVPPIIVDVLRVWPKGEVAAHQSQLADALDMKQVDLSAALRNVGLRAERQVKVRGINQSGYYHATVQAVADEYTP
jgi:S-DNA-T family DNA segregation ATPase FtsK/SpoIIIE